MKVAVIGAGWAGLAAAINAVRCGHLVTVFEASRTVGGRARAVTSHTATLDNGQHILIGAYTETLRLMRLVGVDTEAVLTRLPLTLTYPDGTGLKLPNFPDWASPLDLLAGIVRTQGWTWRDKLSLLRTAHRWQRGGFQCDPLHTVADLGTALTASVREGFLDPLCVSALNTPSAQASGEVFLRVLQDAMFSVKGGSRLLLPRVDLGQLFPEPASRWLEARGCPVRKSERVISLQHQAPHWWANGQRFDQVIVATPSAEAARLFTASANVLPDTLAPALLRWAKVASALRFEAITTVYAQSQAGLHEPAAGLRQPMTALRCTADCPAQFVFDRGQLGGPPGQLAFVISASHGDTASLEGQVVAQAQRQLGMAIIPLKTIVEKRATFACTPGLLRPHQAVAEGLSACGDYIDGPYPATLEGAVRSGWAAGALGVLGQAIPGAVPGDAPKPDTNSANRPR